MSIAWPQRLVVVDVEGNGLHPPDLVEVAAFPLTDGALATAAGRQWLIRPPRPVTPFAARVHGHTTTSLSSCPPWEQIADQVAATLEGAWMCAHHAPVDYRELTRHLPGWKPTGVLDTLRLARATYPGLPSYSLDALIDHAGLDVSGAPGKRHQAPFDAYAAGQLLLDLASHYTAWEALAAAAVPRGMPGHPAAEDTLW
ncbi:DNA polymerase III subunit epsilon [Streptomyces nanshensis]|nr:DNA polymerase III subunit epsilon [Streptomyces nanshensis]